MNGVNINLFQFEYDLTWMAFFMDAHDQVYARYGGREDHDAESHLNKPSLLRIMQQVLDLHQSGTVQTSRYEPTAKPLRTPEEIPTMQTMLARRQNKCIHCHDVKVAQLRHLQLSNEFSRDLVFTYPTPSTVGMQINSQAQNQVDAVAPTSPALAAGIRAGDVLLSANGQRILTLADFARVLQLTSKEGRLPIEIRRDGQAVQTTLELAGDWRRRSDPSWRESLHVAGPNTGLGGKRLETNEKRQLGIAPDALAVKVNVVWGAHSRQAGILRNDVVTAIDGVKHDMTPQQLHAYCMLHHDWGDQVPITVLRHGQEKTITLRFPAKPPWQEDSR